MTTAVDMLTRAARLAGALGQGETLTSEEGTSGLAAIDAMLDGWGISRNAIYQVQNEQFTWAGSAQSQTVGSGGDFNTTRPARIADNCSFTIGNDDFACSLISVDAWAAIPDKGTTSSTASWLYPEYGASLVTLYGHPIPNASRTFNLRSWKALQNFATLTTALAMPPGYERAIVYNIAVEWAGPEFGVTPPAKVEETARASLRALKNINSRSPVLKNETGLMSRRYSSNVKTGTS